jgi:UDP:flavonoid glycosyltransferase YjiC (YdhE family)
MASESRRILHFAHGLGSCNNSLRELVRRLRGAGFELCVASHVDLSGVLEGLGVRFEHLQQDRMIADRRLREIDALPGGNPLKCLVQRIRVSRIHRQHSIAMTEVTDLVHEWKPDLLLIDMECHVAMIQTRKLGIPTVLCSRWFTVFRSGLVPPMHTTLAPPENFAESLRVRWAWTRLMLRKWRLDLRQQFSRRRFRTIHYDSNARSELRAIAAYNGLSLKAITDRSHWLIPHVYRDIPVMSLTAQELEFEDADDPRMHYVGSMVPGDTNDKQSAASVAFQQFVKRRESSGNPLIYCSYSTCWDTGSQNIELLLDLFTRRQDLDMVIGLGGKTQSMANVVLPDNIFMMDYAPQLEVLDKAAVVITHGGISTINEALHKGVPLMVCSAGHIDQNGCMVRLVHHHVGVAASSDPINPVELEHLIDDLLGEQGIEIRTRVMEMQDCLQRYDKNQSAVTFLRSILNDR